MKKIIIHTDGGCRGNPGVGGWGVVIEYTDKSNKAHKKTLKGGEKETTNNRMELTAAIKALSAIKQKCKVELYTDSKYVQQGISQWIASWKLKGWKNAAKKPVKNKDLWVILDELVQKHEVSWHWVKGHSGHAGNDEADQLANEAMDKVKA